MPNEFLRWKLVDPYDGSLANTFTFPRNPNTMTSPFPRRNITATATTAINGRTILTEGQSAPTEWTFGGNVHTARHYEELRSWVYDRTGRRIYLYDHFGRRLTIVPLQFDPTPKRTVGQYYRHTYEITALVLDISGPTFNAELPDAPRGVVAVAGNRAQQLTIAWTAPVSMGGSKLLHYVVEDTTQAASYQVPYGDELSLLLLKRDNRAHNVRVAAVTAAGQGPWAYGAGTPTDVRGPSKIVQKSFVIGRDYATVEWFTPTDDGGLPLAEYYLSFSKTTPGPLAPGESAGAYVHWPLSAPRKYTWKNLLPGIGYEFTLEASNTGPISSSQLIIRATTGK